jgi:hypothetical protein
LAIQPLVFETGNVDYPYSTKGTVFLVGYEGKSYALTTRHGLAPDNLFPICVFPSDTSQRIIPLSNVFFVPRADEPEDFVDLALVEVDPAALTDDEAKHAVLIDLGRAVDADWETDAPSMEFFVIGYPCERSSIDFDSEEIRTDRVTLFARYIGKSQLPHLHLIEVVDLQNLASLDGMSGSPVFMWRSYEGEQPKPVLCGMAIRGTTTAGRIHFLPVSILLDALTIKRYQHENDV